MGLNVEDNYSLFSGINNKGIDDYCNQKISMYLNRNKNYPDLKEIERWENDISNARRINQVSDEVWACLMLKKYSQI